MLHSALNFAKIGTNWIPCLLGDWCAISTINESKPFLVQYLLQFLVETIDTYPSTWKLKRNITHEVYYYVQDS